MITPKNNDEPYEKLEMYGAKCLSNSELLAIIIKTGTKGENAKSLASKVMKLITDEGNDCIGALQNLCIKDLIKIKGIGRVKAIQILATCELANRISKPINLFKIQINNSKDVSNLLMGELKNEKQELVKLLILNSKNVLLKVVDVAIRGS